MAQNKASEESKVVEKRSFTYRGIKKDFTEFEKFKTVTPQRHLELAEKGEVVIVEDRPTDWVELANKDIDKVGLKAIIDLAEKGLVNPFDVMFKDNEAEIDLSDINPMDINGLNQVVNSRSENEAKLEKYASQLGISVEELIKATVEGSLTSLIESKTKKEDISSGGDV